MTRAWTLLRGIAALAALLAAVFGLPAALLAVGGSPIPQALPHLAEVWDTLTSRDDGTVLFAALRVVGWAGWALFTLSVLADLLARVRRVPVPRLGPQQALASQMIAAVIAISVLIPPTTPAAAAPPGPQAAATALSDTTGGPSWLGLGDRLAAAERVTARSHAHQRPSADHSRTWQGYRVRPGDNLWDIADDHLGDPFRWPEIYAASLTVDQPDGHRLHDPDLILPGWTLRIPAASARADVSAPEQPRERHADEHQATVDAQMFKTPLMGGGGPAARPNAPSTPLSMGSAKESPPHAAVAEDWRGQVRTAVPELG